jgi:threonine dehydratase
LIPLEEIRQARERIGDDVLRTPLVPFGQDGRIGLKLECLQPIGCFKLRGALSAVRAAEQAEIEAGIVTASAGNMGQGVAWAAREVGVTARVIVPAEAPRAKLDRIEALGAELVPVTHEEWWQAMVDCGRDGVEGFFVHPVADEAVMAGNGTIGLELAEDAPEFDSVVIPWGGGGLTTGIASAIKALRPGVRVVTAEPETGAPLAAAFAAGEPREIVFEPSWVDGAGGRALLPGMWECAQELVDEAVSVPLADVEEAVRLLGASAHVVAEGAGALALAAALRRNDRCICIVSGGNIDPGVLARILADRELAL